MHRKLNLLPLSAYLLLFGSSCMEDDNPFERVNKLRTVGVKMTTPIVKSGTDSIEFEAVFVHPQGQTVSEATNFTDDSWQFSKAQVSGFQAPTSTTEYGPLSLTTIKGNVTVPTIQDYLFTVFQGVVRVRFGMRVTAGSEFENVVANFLVVKEGDESLEWKSPSVSITTPETETIAYADEIDLVATITKEQEETLKVTWFVSSGKLKNRTAKETKWLEAEKGEQTILFAIYPRKSQFFNWTAKKVIIE